MAILDTTELRKRIDEYYEFGKTLDENVTSKQILAWFDKEKSLKLRAGREWQRLTSDRNSFDTHSTVSIKFMERLIEMVKDGTYK